MIVADVSWQVANARQVMELSFRFGESKQGNLLVVDFDSTNNGGDPVTLFTEPFFLSHNERWAFQTCTLGYADPAKGIFLNHVNPGVTQPGGGHLHRHRRETL